MVLYSKQIKWCSKTRKRWKERFLIRRNRTKRAHFRCNPLFQATYNDTTKNSQLYFIFNFFFFYRSNDVLKVHIWNVAFEVYRSKVALRGLNAAFRYYSLNIAFEVYGNNVVSFDKCCSLCPVPPPPQPTVSATDLPGVFRGRCFMLFCSLYQPFEMHLKKLVL